MNKTYIIILLITMSILVSPVIGEENQTVKKHTDYRIAIDQYHGFYRVYYVNTFGRVMPVPYNGTLTINKGDTITWMNDAMPDVKLTVVSQQKLWDNYAGVLKWAYKQFSYTFNNSGTYDIYVKEYTRFKQKIIVGPITNVAKLNSSNTTKLALASNSSKIDSFKTNSTKTSVTNVSKTDSFNVNSSKANMTDISKTNSSKINLSKTNTTNVSRSTPEKNGVKNVQSLVILPIMAIISIIYIVRRRRKYE